MADILKRLRDVAVGLNRLNLDHYSAELADVASELKRQRAENVGGNEGRWQPIETAPRSRDERIDLCLMDRHNGRQWREPDCHWANDEWGWQSHTGRSVCGKRYYDWDDGGEECFDPICEDEESTVATHWMRPPALPECGTQCGVLSAAADNLDASQALT